MDKAGRTFEVHTTSYAETVEGVADITVGPQGELILAGPDGGCAAMFAPGTWRHAVVLQEQAADGDGADG